MYRMVTNFDYLAEQLPVFDLTNLKVSSIYLQRYYGGQRSLKVVEFFPHFSRA